MSVTLAQAYELAKAAVGDAAVIASAREGSSHWFFEVSDSSGITIPGGSPIAIDKESGEASYPMPAVPSVVLGEPPLPIEDEAERAADVPLPA